MDQRTTRRDRRPAERTRKKEEEKWWLDRIGNQQKWGNLSCDLMSLLRDDLPYRSNTRMKPGGWIKVDVLRHCGFRITPYNGKSIKQRERSRKKIEIRNQNRNTGGQEENMDKSDNLHNTPHPNGPCGGEMTEK